MPSRLFNRDKHRVVLFGVEYLGGYKAGADIAETHGNVLHTRQLAECRDVGALHLFGGGVGGCATHTRCACHGGDNSNVYPLFWC